MKTGEYLEDETQTTVSRRKMIAALMSGGVALSLPAVSQAMPRADDTCVLPTPADALSFYLEFLGAGTISYEILRPYFRIIGQTSSELKRKYTALTAKVASLQQLAPALKTNKEFCQLRAATDAGKTSAASLQTAGNGAVPIVGAQSVMISYLSTSLSSSAGELQGLGDKLVLSEEAVKKLREIICDIEDLLTPTQTIDAASKALQNADEFLRAQTAEVVARLRQAISALVAGEITKVSIAEARAQAFRFIDEAIAEAGKFETYKAPDDLKKYLDEYRARNNEPVTADSTVTNPPALQHFREFLAGVKIWIAQDDWAVSTHPAGNGEVRFVNASVRESPAMLFGIIRQIQAILYDFLPSGTSGRSWYCYGRIKVIFLQGFDRNTRKQKIEGVLQYIWPRGDHDNDPARRSEAAARLNDLPFS